MHIIVYVAELTMSLNQDDEEEANAMNEKPAHETHIHDCVRAIKPRARVNLIYAHHVAPRCALSLLLVERDS